MQSGVRHLPSGFREATFATLLKRPASLAVGEKATFDIAPLTAAVFFALLLALSLYPIFSHAFVSIGDLANHLTRIWVNLHYQDIAELQTYFAPYWHFQPDLALDSVVGVLARFMPVDVAGKVFAAAMFALILSGTMMLHRAAFERWSLWPFLAALLLYNRNLLSGHVNYLFGVGVCLHAAAAWIRLRRHSPLYRMLVLAVLTTATFMCHLFALGLLGLILAGYELHLVWRENASWRQAAVQLFQVFAPFAPPLMIFLFLTHHSATSFTVEYRSLLTRITAFGVFFLYDNWADGLVALVVGTICLILIVTGSLRLHWGLAAGAALLAAAQLVMPNEILTATSVDHRVPIAIVLLLIAATDFASGSGKLKLGFAVTILALVALRVWTVDRRWTQDDAVYAETLAGLAAVPPNSIVASAFPRAAFDNVSDTGIAIYYLPVWDVIRRGGLTQPLFAFPTQHPLMLRQEYAALSQAMPPHRLWETFVAGSSTHQSVDIGSPLMAALDHCDYVAFVDNKAFSVDPTDLLGEVYSNTYIKIYRVRHKRL
jgi:hypothetical protein